MKSATQKLEVDATMGLSWSAVRTLKRVATKALQDRWRDSNKGIFTFALFPKITLGRCKIDFYLNRMLSDHGIIPKHELKMFHKSRFC